MLDTKQMFFAFLLTVSFILPVHGFEVVEEELQFDEPPQIEFENYTGPRSIISTAEEIAGIGRFLGTARERQLNELRYVNRYRIVRAVDRDAPIGLHADILFILEDARVDHIDNIRRILSAYLSETYGYSSADAALLARFITVYNAVHHQDLEFYTARYTPHVLSFLSPSGAGLPLSYRQWPGNSEILIPIRDPDATGRLGIIGPGELIDPAVMEDLRSRRDMGLEERRDMVDFLERLIEEETQEAESERADIAAEREDIDEQRTALDAEREEITGMEEPDPERLAEIDEEEERIIEREREIEEREERVTERETQTEEVREELDRLREDIVDDREEIIDADPQEEVTTAVGLPGLFPMMLVVDTGPLLRSQLVLVEKSSGRIAGRSTASNLIGRQMLIRPEGIIAVSGTQNAAYLSRFDQESLQLVQQSEEQVVPSAALVFANGLILTAVVDGNNAYLAGFTPDLSLVQRSEIRILPHSAIVLEDNLVYVQTPDNRIVALNTDNLEIIE
ncbi:P83/100 family protein [Spirochaeta dissipatitropha]